MQALKSEVNSIRRKYLEGLLERFHLQIPSTVHTSLKLGKANDFVLVR